MSGKSRIMTADVILQLLNPASCVGDSEYGWTLDEAAERISHIKPRGPELYDTLAYLACQVYAYKRMSNEDAAFALGRIETILKNHNERNTK